MLVDYRQLVSDFRDAIRKTPMSSYLILEGAMGLADKFHTEHATPLYDAYNLWAAQNPDERTYKYYIDPDHPFNQGNDLIFARSYMESDFGLGTTMKLPPLVKEASFMLVEDNPLHGLLIDVVGSAENLTRYAPRDEDKVEAPLIQEAEDKGLFASAERALEVISGKTGAVRA